MAHQGCTCAAESGARPAASYGLCSEGRGAACVDIMVDGLDHSGKRRSVAVEVDGPLHFYLRVDKLPEATPATRMRDAAMLVSGIHVRC
jgi:hypothetical protein